MAAEELLKIATAEAMEDAKAAIKDLKMQLDENKKILRGEKILRLRAEKNCSDLQEKLASVLEEKSELQHKLDDCYSLQEDLQRLEEENRQVRSALMTAQTHSDTSTNSTKRATHNNTALVEKLSSMQRERERALLSQLRAAVVERDKALERLQLLDSDLPEAEDQVCCDVSTQSVEVLVQSLYKAKDSQDLKQQGNALVEKVKQLRQNSQEKILQTIRTLTEERDTAASKVGHLEQEISRLLHQMKIMETEYKLVDRTRVKTLQAQLQAAIDEKEAWQTKADKFEDACETLRVINSLQRSLPKENDMRPHAQYEKERAKLKREIQSLHSERNQAVEERNAVIKERNVLAMQAQQEYERAERFQRLVIVLRKKIATEQSGKT